MARIRSTKPEFWSDRKLATRVSRDARLLYIALWNFADEHSRLHGDARYIKGNCLPYDDDIDLTDIDRLLGDLEAAGRIQRYEFDGDPYIYLPKLASHQRLEEKVSSRLPEPPDLSVTQPDPDPDADPDARKSAPDADESAPDPDENALLYVAGGRGQVAGGRGQVASVAPDKPTRAAREPDDVWDALLDACGVDPKNIPATARGAYNAATKQLRDIGATPQDIRRRAAIYRGQWPQASLTPTALARRWAECERPHVTTVRPDATTSALHNARTRALEATQAERKALP